MADEGRRACIMEALHLTGSLILENGGETYRVEDTVERMGRAFGATRVEVFAVTSGVFITLHFEDGTSETGVRRSRKSTTHLSKVDAVNRISREAALNKITPEQALAQLKEIEAAGSAYGPGWMILASALSAGGFSWMFGGAWLDFAVAFATGMLVQLLLGALSRLAYSRVIQSLLGGGLCALVPTLFCSLTGLGVLDAMVAGALMPLLPGLAMTNAVQDTMRGDMLSGVGHGVQAVLTAALVAGGAVFASRLFYLVQGGL